MPGPVVVRVEVPADEAELAADRLFEAGASAVGEEPAGPGWVRLTADVDPPVDLPERWAIEVRPVDDAVLDTWRAHAQPVRAGRAIVLQPSWVGAAERRPGDLVVLLDPGRAFGSGSHPATRLAAAAIEAHGPGSRVLDVGCGSGVLAVVAARLGASVVHGVDLDPEAVRATAANAAANGVADRVHAVLGPVEAVAGAYDLVVANIGLGVLVALAPALVDRTAPGGRLVLSGLLDDQVDAAVAAYPGTDLLAREGEAGWSTVVLARR